MSIKVNSFFRAIDDTDKIKYIGKFNFDESHVCRISWRIRDQSLYGSSMEDPRPIGDKLIIGQVGKYILV